MDNAESRSLTHLKKFVLINRQPVAKDNEVNVMVKKKTK